MEMYCDIAPLFPLGGYWHEKAVAEAVIEMEGRRYHLRRLYDYMLFRRGERDSVEHTLFLTRRLTKKVTGPTFPEMRFEQQVRAGEFGRMALYECPLARDCQALLFFGPDGTGFFHEQIRYGDKEPVDIVPFTWEAQTVGLASCAEIVDADYARLLSLCEEVFVQQVWPNVKDPWMPRERMKDERLTWDCGAQAELERLTRLIYYTEPSLFAGQEQEPAYVRYYAACSQSEGKADLLGKPTSRQQALCDLAFQHNHFRGAKWATRGGQRLQRYYLEPYTVFVIIQPPSAHERAEALLELLDWLTGKVPAETIGRYLNTKTIAA